MNDAIDGIMEASDDEQEEEDIVNQVLDEIGIDLENNVCLHLIIP